MTQTYKIIRKHFQSYTGDEVIKTGLTLEQAQAHCNDPESSSKTAKSRMAKNYTLSFGEWFDAYYRE